MFFKIQNNSCRLIHYILQSVRLILKGLRCLWYLNEMHLLTEWRRSAGMAAHPGVRAGHGVNKLSSCLELLHGLLVSRNTHIRFFSSVPVKLLSFGLHVCVALEFDCTAAMSGAGKQHSNISAKFRAEAEVDERIVEACGLGEEPGEDAGQTGYVKAAR